MANQLRFTTCCLISIFILNRNLIADDRAAPATIQCFVDDVEFSLDSVLPIRLQIWNGGDEELVQLPEPSWLNGVIAVHFRDAKSKGDWLKMATPRELGLRVGVSQQRISIKPQRSRQFYEALPLWRLPTALRESKQLEMKVTLRFEKQELVINALARMSVAPLPAWQNRGRDGALLGALTIWQNSSNLDRTVLDLLPDSDAPVSLKQWIRLTCAVQDLAPLTRDSEALEKQIFDGLKRFPTVAREAIGLKLCAEMIAAAQNSLPEPDSSKDVFRRNLEIAKELLEPCRIGCLETMHLIEQIQRLEEIAKR